MKTKYLSIRSLLLASLASVHVSCGNEDEKVVATVAGGDAAAKTIEVAQSRVDALGFASRLPKDTEVAMGLRNLGDVVDTFVASNFFKKATSLAASGGEGPPPEMVDEVRAKFGQYAGKDAFFSIGAGGAEQIGILMEAYGIYNAATYRMLMQGLASGGGLEAAGMSPETMIKDVLRAEDGKLLDLLEKLQMPPILAGTRITGGAEEVLGQLAEAEGQLPPVVVVSEEEIEGVGKFKIWSVAAKDALGENERSQLRDQLDDAALSERVEKIIDGKKLEFAYGLVGDTLLVSLGSDHAHLKLAVEPEESLLAAPAFAFADRFAGKKLFAYAYTSEEVLATMNRPEQILDLTKSIQGLVVSLAENGMDLGEVGGLVGKLGEQFVAMAQRGQKSALAVAYLEEGIRYESIGGYDNPALDTEAKLVFADAIPSDAFLSVNAVSTAKSEEQSIALLETLGQLAYAGGKAFGGISGDPNAVEQFNQMDALFRPKLLALWEILRNKLEAGLGSEVAFVVDLKGSMPKIPGVPNVLSANGKVPRILMAQTVKDRALVSQAWDEMVPVINDIAKSIPGQEQGAEFQLPDPVTSEKGELKTHFITLPFTSNDFLPSISISDKLFFMSTSKNLSEDIAATAKPGEKTGMVASVNFDALRAFGNDWLRLVMENTEEVFGGDQFQADSFRENASTIDQVLEMSQALHRLDARVFVEDGQWRASAHLKLSDLPASVD